MEDAVKSLKEFTWDIIGYLIPGFLLIVVFNFVVIPEVGIKNSFLIDWSTFGAYVYVVLSYILGYVVYSLTILKIRVQDTLLGWLKGKYAIGKYVKKNTVEVGKSNLPIQRL